MYQKRTNLKHSKGVGARKSLGQHFLTSRSVVRTIIASSNISPDDVVLEIGPGKGMLTEALLSKAKRVIALEKDHELVQFLRTRFSLAPNLKIHEIDALLFDPSKLGTYKIVANIPYYITGALLEKFLTEKNQPVHMTLLLQKEVAERIARSKKESILSVSVKAYGDPTYEETVLKKQFAPKPEVDSAVLTIKNISRDTFIDVKEEQLFFTLLKQGFSQKRKLLINNLENGINKKDLRGIFSTCTIPERTRAENLSKEQWICLAKQLEARTEQKS